MRDGSIPAQVLNLLGAPLQTPLTQSDIAYRTYNNAPSVRRTVQELTRAGKIHVVDYAGYAQTPLFAIGAKPAPVELSLSVDGETL